MPSEEGSVASPAQTLPKGWRLDGQVALVTGAAGGLGSAIVRALAALGAQVMLAELPAQLTTADDLAREVEVEYGAPTTAVALDVTDVPLIRRVVDRIVEETGRLDILVANAGINIRQPALEVTEEAWDQVLAVDLRGVFFCCQAAGRQMIRQRYGRIVNVASQNGIVGMEDRIAYCTAKAGVVNLTRVLALEWAMHGVRVNAVGPTFIDTPLTRGLLADPATRDSLLGRIPIGRLGTPEEVAAAVAFLASPAAELITGHTLVADGGWTAA
ncbi:MAG: 2-deoxy-D-gluconate 3-dehydrogenase [Dehalococcoidia bacterium]|nr:2-deoxy-D-gluconate 3-dehydrogenase [Dehalococcoidia bacterium]